MSQLNAAMFLGLKYERMTLTLEEACNEICISARTGANQISAGTFPMPTRKEGGKRVVDIRDLAEYIDKQRQIAIDQWKQDKTAP